jgi:hypothetical protein
MRSRFWQRGSKFRACGSFVRDICIHVRYRQSIKALSAGMNLRTIGVTIASRAHVNDAVATGIMMGPRMHSGESNETGYHTYKPYNCPQRLIYTSFPVIFPRDFLAPLPHCTRSTQRRWQTRSISG